MTHKNLIYCILSLSIVACSPKTADEQDNTTNDWITITTQQFEAEKMQLGDAQSMTFYEFVNCNGTLVSKPDGMVKISTPVEGRIHAIRCNAGQRVTKGQTLFEITGNEVIEIQRTYTEAASRLKRLTSEYERTKALYNEQIGAQKEFLAIESEYHIAKANHSALKLKIEQMNLDAASLEDGRFQHYFPIRSPMNGYISELQVVTGQHIEPQTHITEIIDPQKFQLQLSLFEKDWSRIKVTQTVYFNLLNNTETFEATISATGISIDSQSKTLTAYAQPKTTANFVNHAFVEARIATATDTVMAVPEEAILKQDDQHYLLQLIKEENGTYYFERIQTQPKRTYNGYVEIETSPELGKIITKGAYNIVID
jgi:cobalt-zinc-cadmium efflux system membrane fusion protein